MHCGKHGEVVGHSRWRIVGEQSLGIYNLNIRNASLSDDGDYQCQVGPYGRIKAIRTKAKLTVLCKYKHIQLRRILISQAR
ncbi:hypothetical protein TSAR_002283 [Trichomalopsis sarcophagae]|uniref:Ig-like domain-containing protein n=1 Tax=Trichomalopsis sarcophagae TaxID=543379 RepID=A0A232FA31_9HYME|nr:hypothetical protein TSAR_002283 [Trichomalopsis sarcophagae]